MIKKYVLVVRADQTVRIARKPRIMADEIGIPLTLNFPEHWGHMLRIPGVTISVPDFTPEVTQEFEVTD